MSRKLFILMAVGALIAGCFGSAFAALSVHQNGTWGTEGACAVCHNNNPTPALRGWGITGTPPGGLDWYTAKIAPLCYPCHRGGNTYGASAMETYAYANASHGFGVTQALGAPYTANSWMGSAATETYTGTGLPYVGTAGSPTNIDCTTCHNVHNNDFAPFSMKGAAVGSLDFSTLCKTCHAGRTGGTGVAAGNVNGAGSTSTHPTDLAVANLAGNGVTRFVTPDARVSRVASIASWGLGGKRVDGTAGAAMSCQTCHAVHGDEVAAVVPYEDLLAIPNVGVHATGAATTLCTGCHGNPYGGAVATVGSGTDHPIDGNGGWAFYPSTAAGDWASAVGVPSQWVAANHYDSGATGFDPTASANVACTSCHDTHGGITATSMLRGPNTVGGGTGDWCFNCHPASTLVPDYHHSVQGNWASSVLYCGDCHGTAGATTDTWSAHNGFYSFRAALSATNSTFCETCHTATNPMVGLGEFAGTLATPAHHGPAIASLGTNSHSVNENNTAAMSNIVRYVGDWSALANGPIDQHGDTTRSEWGAAGETLCESCHNIIDNVGNRASSASVLAGGWEANILLLAFEDDTAGVAQGETPDLLPNSGDAFCRVCHNLGGAGAGGYVHYPAAHTVVGATYAAGETPYGRTTATILTNPASACPEKTTADTPTAPGTFSYPAVNTVDCDTCHRAHNGWSALSAAGGGETDHVIVQDASAALNPKTGPCAVCHSVDIMCGY